MEFKPQGRSFPERGHLLKSHALEESFTVEGQDSFFIEGGPKNSSQFLCL